MLWSVMGRKGARSSLAWSLGGVGVLGVLVCATVALQAGPPCPDGYKAVDPVELAREFRGPISATLIQQIRERFGEHGCLWRKAPESLTEFAEAQEARTTGAGVVPDGAFRNALEQKQASQALQAQVPGATGQWQPYGDGPQVQDQAYADGSRDGIPVTAGRVDNFAYDDVGKRLFAAVGNGGIWMTEAIDGDLATLASPASPWRSIGDGLPIQVTSAVAWTPAKGGRVIALTGEHTQGGNSYVGLGAYWSDDLGAIWNRSAGIPDGAFSFKLAVDQSNPKIIYAATGKGLFRSEDAGESFVNVKLPTSEECAGVESVGKCGVANMVTDVVVRQPGGLSLAGLANSTCDVAGCPVLAAVGYRAGNLPYADGTPQSPGNGLYRSDTGAAGSFQRVAPALPVAPLTGGILPVGFPPQERLGRIELGAATGPHQDHNIVYAIVQDAVLFNQGVPVLDLPKEIGSCDAGAIGPLCPLLILNPTTINGVYVSMDFGDTWTRLADDVNLTYNLASGSSLAPVAALGFGPGVQAWYDLWIQPDPTLADPVLGAPTRVVFGMEEMWKNTLSGLPPLPVVDPLLDEAARQLALDQFVQGAIPGLLPVIGATEQLPLADFEVFGSYFAGETCLFLLGSIGPPMPVCPTYDGLVNGTTTHPDQHDGIFIPDPQRGGVWLFVGNDGGVFKQYSHDPILDDLANNKWGNGANDGFYTLMNYGIGVSNDGTVYYGLQDNSSGKIEPGSRRQLRTYVGDGVWSAAHPTDSRIAYVQTPGLAIVRTTDGGHTHTGISPGAAAGTASFLSPFVMDPQDPEHLVAVGTKVAENLKASSQSGWVTVFDLGVDEASGAAHVVRALAVDVERDAVYTGWCGPCNVLKGVNPGTVQFQRGLATNVGGDKPPKKGSPAGWHQASAKGLPNRFIYAVEIAPDNPRTVYVTLGGYSTARWLPPGQYEDQNPNIGAGHVFKSTDAGENFRDITGNLPEVVVSAIMQRGNQLIVGTDIGVFISSDLEGTMWAPLGDLPAVPINQLVLRPGNPNQLFAATFGRGVQVYEFTGAAAMKETPLAQGEGRGVFLGALSPAALAGLLLAGLAGRWRHRRAKAAVTGAAL